MYVCMYVRHRAHLAPHAVARRTFHAHHSAAISVAIVASHATLIHERAKHMSSMLTMGLTPAD